MIGRACRGNPAIFTLPCSAACPPRTEVVETMLAVCISNAACDHTYTYKYTMCWRAYMLEGMRLSHVLHTEVSPKVCGKPDRVAAFRAAHLSEQCPLRTAHPQSAARGSVRGPCLSSRAPHPGAAWRCAPSCRTRSTPGVHAPAGLEALAGPPPSGLSSSAGRPAHHRKQL